MIINKIINMYWNFMLKLLIIFNKFIILLFIIRAF